MYESSILNRGPALPLCESAAGKDSLRALTWGELVARLGAGRDFGRIMATRHQAGEGSFDRFSARHLAGIEADIGDGQQAINPFALGNRKAGQGKKSGVTKNTTTGDRG